MKRRRAKKSIQDNEQGRFIKRLGSSDLECLTEIDDITALPALIALLEFTKPAIQDALIPSITRMLTRVQPSDAHLLGFRQQSALARMFSTSRTHSLPVSFFLAILQAFEQVGDSRVLPAVAWLAQGKGAAAQNPTFQAAPHTVQSPQEQFRRQQASSLQAAAQTCQAHLQEQLRRQQASSFLLRSSSLAETPHTLLRPAAGAPDLAPHELLRADNTHERLEPVALQAAPPQTQEPQIALVSNIASGRYDL